MEEHILFLLKTFVFIGFIIAYIIYKVYKVIQDKKEKQFPPWSSECPDHWEVVGKNICKNSKNIGNCSLKEDGSNIMDFSKEDLFTGDKGKFFKCEWAKNCNVSWEGIDNLCI
jgi:hypothetical protein